MEYRRLNKYISDTGYCSRREADRLILEGRVSVDGRPAVMGEKLPAGARVTIDGEPIGPDAECVYIALNKPRGVVCTTDSREPMNIVDYLSYPVRIFPVGRLDKDSEGLILLTNDGSLVNSLLRAEGGHEREYEVTVDRSLTPGFLRSMAEGVPILDTVTLPCRVRRTGEKSFRIVLVQGLNRQIRRMCEALGYRVASLVRLRIENIRLGSLASGEYRLLTKDELSSLMAGLKEHGARGSAGSQT